VRHTQKEKREEREREREAFEGGADLIAGRERLKLWQVASDGLRGVDFHRHVSLNLSLQLGSLNHVLINVHREQERNTREERERETGGEGKEKGVNWCTCSKGKERGKDDVHPEIRKHPEIRAYIPRYAFTSRDTRLHPEIRVYIPRYVNISELLFRFRRLCRSVLIVITGHLHCSRPL
jgi:hypothetical protein